MTTNGSEFEPIIDMDGEHSDEEEKHPNNISHLEALQAMATADTKRLNNAFMNDTDTQPIVSSLSEPKTESKYNDMIDNDKITKNTPWPTDDGSSKNSILIYSLDDKDQKPPPKLAYHEHEFGMDNPNDTFQYHPTLGDLEKRQIWIETVKNIKTKNNKKRSTKIEREKRILWFAKEHMDSLRKVFISLKIKRISAIDNVKETFRMRFHMYLNWIMTETEYRQYRECIGGKYYYEPTWKPDLEFMNAVETHKQDMFPYPEQGKFKVEILKDFWVDKAGEACYEKQFDPTLCYFIRTKLECDMTFAEELELQSFPFDCQDLSCVIKGNFLNKQKYVFLPELRHSKFASIDPRYSVLDEWDLSTALIEFADDESGRTSGRAYPTLVIRLKMERKWRIYVINIVLLLFLLCGLSLCAFYLTHEQLGERLGLLVTLLLTSVAFSIVIQDKLPNVAYLTFIDKYILMSYLWLIGVVVESVWVSTMDNEENREKMDIFLFYVASGLWIIVMGIFFVIYGYKLRKKEKLKLFYSSDKINEKVNQTLPRLVFDYRNSQRTGHDQRILSFMAQVKTNRNTPEYIRKQSENVLDNYRDYMRSERKRSVLYDDTERQSEQSIQMGKRRKHSKQMIPRESVTYDTQLQLHKS